MARAAAVIAALLAVALLVGWLDGQGLAGIALASLLGIGFAVYVYRDSGRVHIDKRKKEDKQ